jgi:hypothetical protein
MKSIVGDAVTLARLAEGSLDRWDEPALVSHLEFLEALSRQAVGYELALGQDVDLLPESLAAML